jgi:porphobilinogen synthase
MINDEKKMQYLKSTMASQGQYPDTRFLRNRQSPWLRRLVAETTLSVDDLILPTFIRDSLSEAEVPSMPGVRRYTCDELVDFAGQAHDLKIPAIYLFPYFLRENRNEDVLQMLTPDNMICQAVRKIRAAFPDMGVIVDLALDCYSTHGQDGLVKDGKIMNDETVEVLADYAVVLAQAGVNIIAPSDMMDGRVGVTRRRLDAAGFQDVCIMSYAAKYASNFYGPFRDAVGSKTCLAQADKMTYQIDFRNSQEALREVALDIQEGADMVIVKPGLPYLDIVKGVKDTFGVPTLVYHISGEYAMLKAAAAKGWLDYDKCLYEVMMAFKRAGADGILSYAALEAAKLIKEG